MLGEKQPVLDPARVHKLSRHVWVGGVQATDLTLALLLSLALTLLLLLTLTLSLIFILRLALLSFPSDRLGFVMTKV